MTTLLSSKKLCVLPRISGVGGPASFQLQLVKGLASLGVEVCHDLQDIPYDAVLVVGGTRQLMGLWRVRKRGIPILQRLAGINWLHRLRRTGLRHFLRAERGNRLLATIRARLADGVVYQSQFARAWWERVYGPTPVPACVVLNGVDLEDYTPAGSGQRPSDRYRLLMIEGILGGGYEIGVEHAVGFAERLAGEVGQSVELMVVGRVAPALRERIERSTEVLLRWVGVVPRDRIPEIDRSAHVLYSADLNAACPNAVIEALACGLPVVAFDTGALPELVTENAGRLSPYGGDTWKLDPPDMESLVQATLEVLGDQPRFRAGARARAEACLDLKRMVVGYLTALGWI